MRFGQETPLPVCLLYAVVLASLCRYISLPYLIEKREMDQNPALVQTAPLSKQGAAPLILIHDGGGTTFSYHCLKSLHRTVYTIHNPRFYSGRVWAGGITAMAKVYVEMIRSVVPLGGSWILGGKFRAPLSRQTLSEDLVRPKAFASLEPWNSPYFFFFLFFVNSTRVRWRKSCEQTNISANIHRGWSLGGLISLEIASLLSQTANLDLLGLIMIDSICPRALNHPTQNIVPHRPFTSPHCKPEIGFLISNQLKASAKLVQDWVMPHWSSRPGPISLSSRSWTGVTDFDRSNNEEESLMAGSVSSRSSASSISSSSRDRSWGSSSTTTPAFSSDDIDDKPSPEPELPIGDYNHTEDEDDGNRSPDSSPPPPPFTILLRCDEYVPVSRSKNPDAISKVDIVRDRRLLGWDEYAPDLVQCVLSVPGHHFNLFAEENVSCPPPLSFPSGSPRHDLWRWGGPKAEILEIACRLK